MYSVIIPVYNRVHNLECCLACLMRQEFADFEIIVCDDGSDEDTLSLVRKYDRIKYYWHPHSGFRAGQVRNRGVSLSTEKADSVIFLDSDVIVRSNWLAEFDRLHREFPKAVVCARYDFLMPMEVKVEDVIHRFDDVICNQLPILFIPRGELVGTDLRAKLFMEGEKKHLPGSRRGGAMQGGNTLVPKEVFEKVGGFDENIVLHGGEDSDCGQSIEELGYGFVFSMGPMGWHLYHKKKPQAELWQDLYKNIKYIDAKHKKRRGAND